MLRALAFSMITGSVIAIALTGPAHAESFTTRIETRPFYGAVVTIEEGVRVFRALPPDRQVIINPNRTPLVLGFNETTVYDQRSGYGGGYGAAIEGGSGAGFYSAPVGGLYGHRIFNRNRGFFGHRSGGGHPGMPRGGVGSP